jgi:hypothetical protein
VEEFSKMHYMFQAVPPPIIRSSKLYIQHLVFVKPLLLHFTVVEEFPKMLYMFQAVPPPIIRSSKTVHTAFGIY